MYHLTRARLRPNVLTITVAFLFMIMVDEYDVQIVQPTSEWHSKNDAEMMVQHKFIPQSQKIFKEYYLTILRRLRDCH